MSEMDLISKILSNQRDFFRSGKTFDSDWRRRSLTALSEQIQVHEVEIMKALAADLGKPEFESYVGEILLLHDEIKFALKNLNKWMRPKKVSTPWVQFPASSRIYFEPKGVVLIIGPWNYPFQLCVAPLVGALAAGNCVVIKPSELSPATSAVVKKVISSAFPSEQVTVIEGGVETSKALLEHRFDHIFFTGGSNVGRIVMTSAAKYLTPVTLELGGKSPCLIDESTDLEITARRIAWGKFFNAGQTCVAPDYVLVPEKLKAALIEKLIKETKSFFGEDASQSPDYGRIINHHHFERLAGLLQSGKVVLGGDQRKPDRYLSPTILDNVKFTDRVMEDEIFGPILPILSYQSLDEAIKQINSRPKPLAFYFFSSSSDRQKTVLRKVPFGGGCINDTLVHLSNAQLPFGGVGDSGMGSYHGRFGFETFSHQKSVVKRGFMPDVKLRYPPYRGKLPLIKKLLG